MGSLPFAALVALAFAIAAADAIPGGAPILLTLLVVPPLIAATTLRPRATALLAGLSLLLALAGGLWDDFLLSPDHITRVAVVSLGGLSAVWAARLRTRAESGRRRASFLAEVSEALASSLDYRATLGEVARVAVASIADWAMIDLLDDEGELRRVAVAHADPAHAPVADALGQTGDLYPGRIADVVATGAPLIVENLDPDSVPEPRREPIRRSGMRSYVIVRLESRGRPLGALVLGRRERRGFALDADVELAQDIARRAALAIDNARLFQEAHNAQRDAAAAERRAAFLAEASLALDSSLDPRATLRSIAHIPVPEMADLAVIDLLTPDGNLRGATVAAADSELAETLGALRERFPIDPAGNHPVARALRDGAQVVGAMSPEMLRGYTASEEHYRFMLRTRYHSAVVAPLQARGRVLGVLSLLRLQGKVSYDQADLAFVEELARRAALALDNSRLYDDRSSVAQALQERLLPAELPEVPGIELGAVYRPATAGLEVGGDFYDAFMRDDGLTLAVGDVCGKGAEAAALTGLARDTIRAASDYERRPEQMLRTLNRAVLDADTDWRFITVAYARLQAAGRETTATLACGGHPPPLVLRAGGVVERIGTSGTVIGIEDRPTFDAATCRLSPGDALVLYTDGITEAPFNGGHFGEAGLTDAIARCRGMSARDAAVEIADEAIGGDGGRRDDAVVVVARVSP